MKINILHVRRIVSLVLLIASLASFIIGFILYLDTTKVLYKIIEPLPTPRLLHTYVSFIASGATLIHIYLNWNSIKLYIKPKK